MRNIILLASILFLASSCTTIMSGKTQEMTFDSEPQGVEVNVSGKVIGRTPTTVQLDKKKDQTLTFSLEGYKTQTRNLATTVDPWFFGNVIFTNPENILKADVIEMDLKTKDTKIFMYEKEKKVNIKSKNLNGNN